MENLVQVDRQTPFLLPQDLRDWLPKNHIVHFIIEAVEAVSPKVSFHLNKRGSGSKQFNPEMMMELLIYSYCTKRFSSYAIEKATYTDIPTMYITAMEHPDHNTINNFRKNNREASKKAFTQLLLLAQSTGLMKKIGTISVDGTKIHANESKHKNRRRTENLLKKKDNCRTCLWNYKTCNGIPPVFDARSRKHRY